MIGDGWAAIEGEPTVASAGELAAIAAFTPRLPASTQRILGPGDDAAVLSTPDGRIVITTDTMVHGPDFRTAWSSPFDLGWKLAASNLADIAAMGAVPTALVVSLVVPQRTPVRVLCEIADGLREACAALAPGCGVEGGDLATGAAIVAAATAFGDLQGRAPVTRVGARPGDVVAISGALGAAARGIARLFAEATLDGEPDAALGAALRAADQDVEAQLRPTPPIHDGVLAAIAGATAMLDVSDGLVLDARRIAAASGATIDLHSSAIGGAAALHGGEDHSLLATFPPEVALPGGFRVIGTVMPGTEVDGAAVTVDGEADAANGGWDPFAGWDGRAG
jgi:thiamine-monophosphate kinase